MTGEVAEPSAVPAPLPAVMAYPGGGRSGARVIGAAWGDAPPAIPPAVDDQPRETTGAERQEESD